MGRARSLHDASCVDPPRAEGAPPLDDEIVCYCSHDDLWLPFHIEEMETILARCCFAHSIHAAVKVPQGIKDKDDFLYHLCRISLRDKNVVKRMRRGQSFFGLTFGAHTRESYNELDEGWVTTPKRHMATDSYMWQKFLCAYQDRCDTVMRITALHFGKGHRLGWSEQERAGELKRYLERIQDSVFLTQIDKIYDTFPLSRVKQMRELVKKMIYWKFRVSRIQQMKELFESMFVSDR